MREKRPFGRRTRTSETKKINKKYFLVFEGSDTEVIYFDKLNSMRKHMGFNLLIEIVPIIKSFSEEGWSNPKKILDGIIDDLEKNNIDNITYVKLFDRMMDCICEDNENISKNKGIKNSIWKTMKLFCENNCGKTLDDKVEDVEKIGNEIFEILKEKYEIENLVENIAEIISYGGWSYEEEFDEICLIVDRDKESFISRPENDQYKYVVEKCKEKGFRFCVTNPCFEFWLLMHFESVFELDEKQLLENNKITTKRRYAENELNSIFKKYGKTYKKSFYDAEMLIKNIDTAIKNEKEFCEDIEGLKDSIGSNIGLLIEDMRK